MSKMGQYYFEVWENDKEMHIKGKCRKECLLCKELTEPYQECSDEPCAIMEYHHNDTPNNDIPF